MILNRQAILAADDLVTETVDVPEWGGDVNVRTLNGFERDDFEAVIMSATGSDDKVNLRGLKARLVVLTVVDDEGQPLFKPDEVDALNAKSAAALNRIFEVAQRLNGLTESDVKELAGNSPSGLNDDSGSE